LFGLFKGNVQNSCSNTSSAAAADDDDDVCLVNLAFAACNNAFDIKA